MFIYVENYYLLQYSTQILSMVAMFGVWTVLYLCILMSSDISEIYRIACFGYFSDISHIPDNLVPSLP